MEITFQSHPYQYHSLLIEQMLLGLIAYRVGQPLGYTGAEGTITNHADANALLKRSYRDGQCCQFRH